MSKKSFPYVLAFFLLCSFMYAADKQSDLPTPGLIFNAPNLLMDIQEYQGSPSGQGGIGFKLKDITVSQFLFDVRGILGLHLRDGFDSYRLDLGLATEFHLIRKSQISPYWGLFTTVGFDYTRTDVPPGDNWTVETNIPLSFGPTLGVEVFLTEFVSFFAEYSISADFTFHQQSSNTTSPVSSTTFTLNTALGNGAMLGFVIYFKPVVELNK